MEVTVRELFQDYPNPFFLVQPIYEDGISVDFEYIYVNEAFSSFLGSTQAGMIGQRYRQCFQAHAEQTWLDLFADVARQSKHLYVDQVSDVIQRKLFTEAFHVSPDLCACIIHDYAAVPGALTDEETAELRRQASTDCLTGFYNRFYLRELTKALCGADDLGIVFLDINGLKIINDTCGHSAGDQRILEVCRLLRSHYPDAQIFRIGGDEFVVIAAGLTRETFLAQSDQAHTIFSDTGLASMGYLFFDHVDDLQSCISQCDTLMYMEKRRTKSTRV